MLWSTILGLPDRTASVMNWAEIVYLNTTLIEEGRSSSICICQMLAVKKLD